MKDKKIKKIEQGIEALQKQLNELKEPKFEVGKWYLDKEKPLYIVNYSGDRYKNYGFGTNGMWSMALNMPESDDHRLRPATDQEVETALIAEAKRRGIVSGANVVPLWKSSFESWDITGNNSVFKQSELSTYTDGDISKNNLLYVGGSPVFWDGKWATIIEPTVTINGYDMKQEGDVITFGCAKFHKHFFLNLKGVTDQCNGLPNELNIKHRGIEIDNNRKIKSITLDSGVEITVEDLKKICDNIK